MDVLIVAAPKNGMERWIGWQGQTVGISGQFLVVKLTYDPRGNKVGDRPLVMFEPLDLESPTDWAARE